MLPAPWPKEFSRENVLKAVAEFVVWWPGELTASLIFWQYLIDNLGPVPCSHKQGHILQLLGSNVPHSYQHRPPLHPQCLCLYSQLLCQVFWQSKGHNQGNIFVLTQSWTPKTNSNLVEHNRSSINHHWSLVHWSDQSCVHGYHCPLDWGGSERWVKAGWRGHCIQRHRWAAHRVQPCMLLDQPSWACWNIDKIIIKGEFHAYPLCCLAQFPGE